MIPAGSSTAELRRRLAVRRELDLVASLAPSTLQLRPLVTMSFADALEAADVRARWSGRRQEVRRHRDGWIVRDEATR